MSNSVKPRVIIIGIDGASWNLIKFLVDNNDLPTFKHLMENGAWGPLKSTIPPVTFPAWESIFSGQNPGEFGVFDFVGVDIKNRKLIINTPNKFRSKPIWSILNEYGYKTCMVNIPTSKINKVKGVIIGGPFSDKNVAYPMRIKTILDQFNYEFYPKELTKSFMESSKKYPSFTIIKKTISSRFDIVRYLIKTENPDFVAFVIFIIDNIQHFYWGEDIVYNTWKLVDYELGKFISEYKDSFIIIVSDHGFTKLSKIFYISKFLEERELIKYKSVPLSRLTNKISTNKIINYAKKIKIDGILLRLFPKKILIRILSNFPTEDGGVGVNYLSRIIDWEKSKCIPVNSGIYINCTDKEKEHLKNSLKSELIKLDGVIRNVYFKEEIYWGKYLEQAPDLIIEPADGVRILDRPYSKTIISDEISGGWKGVHTSDGIIILYGNGIKKANINATVYDIVPTVLYIFGINPPKYMKGRVLRHVIINNNDLYALNLKYKTKKLKYKICRKLK